MKFLGIEEPQHRGYPQMMRVALPDGWEVQCNGYWTFFMDEQGRCRVQVFFKDEVIRIAAHSELVSCFTLCHKVHSIEVMTNGEVIHTVPFAQSTTNDEYVQSQRDAEEKAKEWLNKKYPLWNDPVESWGYRI